MFLEQAIQDDCVISGSLCFVLYISRIAGVAPIKFRKERGGWRISLSRFWHVFNVIFAIFMIFLSADFTMDDRGDVVDGYESASNTGFMRIVLIVLLSMVTAVVLLSSVYGYHRLHHMIDCIFQLEQINSKLNYLVGVTPSNEKTMWFIVILVMVHGNWAVSLDFVPYITEVIIINKTLPLSSCSFISAFITILQLQLIAIQFMVVCLRLVATQKRINNYLKEQLEDLRNRASTLSIIKPKTTVTGGDYKIDMNDQKSYRCIGRLRPFVIRNDESQILNQITNIYCSICSIIKQLNESSGVTLIMLLLFIMIHMVTAPYFIVSLLYRNNTQIPTLKACAVFGWCSLCLSILTMAAEPCHQCHYQLNLTKKLINQLIRLTPIENCTVIYELKMFKRHILLNPVTFRPLHLLLFDRRLIVAVLSTTVTYLSVVINL